MIHFGSFDKRQHGSKEPPHRRAVAFFDRFPELLVDDREDEFNGLIEMLRDKALDYFRKEIIHPMVDKILNESTF